jgi:predicted RNA-binding Zn ribbon-like protein
MPEHRGRIEAIRLVGGATCLDFVNTANGRRLDGTLPAMEESLCGPLDVVAWGLRAELLTPAEHGSLLVEVVNNADAARSSYAALIVFREALYRLFEALVADPSKEVSGIDNINAVLSQTAGLRKIAACGDRFDWAWHKPADPDSMFDVIMGKVAMSTAELLVNGEMSKLRICDFSECDWVFLDTSKNGRRRWCQMDVCGNRAKARRRAHLLPVSGSD